LWNIVPFLIIAIDLAVSILLKRRFNNIDIVPTGGRIRSLQPLTWNLEDIMREVGLLTPFVPQLER